MSLIILLLNNQVFRGWEIKGEQDYIPQVIKL